MGKEIVCKNCWFIKHAGEAMLSNSFKCYETDNCSLEDTPLPKKLTCSSWMNAEGSKGEDK